MFASAERHLPAALDLLRELVAVNSFTTNGAGVEKVAGITAEAFAPMGFEAEFVPCEVPGSGPHLFLSRTGEDPSDRVLLVTHSDTVFPEEEEERNEFCWDVRSSEGRIYGPGTIDIKGGTALIWMILRMLADEAPDRFARTSWMIGANAAEEVTGDDFAKAAAVRCRGRAKAVLVYEGGPVDDRGWHLVTSLKGRSTWRLEAEGRAAHAGSKHHEGINAIDALVSVLPSVAALTLARSHRTVNIGRVDGGTVVNRVPHEAFAEWECRATHPDVLEEADAAFAALTGPTETAAFLRATRTGHTPPWPGGEDTAGLFAVWRAAAASAGLPAVSVARGGLSDANHLWHLGPTLDGLGPSGGNAHCSERSADGSKIPEYLDVGSMVPKAVMNALALTQLGASA
jgi:glutamate carboxypeptidase